VHASPFFEAGRFSCAIKHVRALGGLPARGDPGGRDASNSASGPGAATPYTTNPLALCSREMLRIARGSPRESCDRSSNHQQFPRTQPDAGTGAIRLAAAHSRRPQGGARAVPIDGRAFLAGPNLVRWRCNLAARIARSPSLVPGRSEWPHASGPASIGACAAERVGTNLICVPVGWRLFWQPT
jgi:hypothetical protein